MKSNKGFFNFLDKLFIFLKTFQGKTVVGILLFFIVLSLTYTNCARTNFINAKNAGVGATGANFCVFHPADPSCQVSTNVNCNFNGQVVQNGKSITAYQNSTGTCTSETRVCTNGHLSGSYNFANCQSSGPAACLFNGETIAHGQSIVAYLVQSSVSTGSCQSETRICSNGSLSGSYSFSNCSDSSFNGCLFNGQTIAHGQSTVAYLNSSVTTEQTCQSQTRTCHNGTLSGSYNYASCTVDSPAACTFNGQTVAHGQTVIAFLASTVTSGQLCQSESRTCNNGTLSGSYSFASCLVNQPASCTFNGRTIAHNATVEAYLNSSAVYGSTCAQEARTCQNGVLSGSYTFANCSVSGGANCLFNGQTIAHGQNITAYLNSSVNFGQTCTRQTRTCNNGVLSGNYSFASCSVGQAAACTFNGQTVAHGGSVTAYSASSVAAGLSCVGETRTCNDGQLSGSFTFGSCSVNQAAACMFNGKTIPSGGYVTAYAVTNVNYGENCPAETRYCQNGILRGSYQNDSCVVNQPMSCTFNDRTYPHGQILTMYSASTVTSPTTCSQISTTRTCSNGRWLGSANYYYPTCKPAYRSCSFNGQPVDHGGSIKAYASTSVAYGQQCKFELRKCNDGVLDGSYSASSCSPQNPASCTTTNTVLLCGIKVKCKNGRKLPDLNGQNVVSTIGGVAHDQYGYIIGLSNGYTATRLDNIRYQCDNGNFNWAPTGPTWCGGESIVPDTDPRCKITFWDDGGGSVSPVTGGGSSIYDGGDAGGGCGDGGSDGACR